MIKHLSILLFLLVSLEGVSQTNTSAPIPDARIFNHYTAAQVAEMDAHKINVLNFIFRSSFVINADKPCPECPSVDVNTFDVMNYQREHATRKRVYLSQPGHPIDLLSVVELDAAIGQLSLTGASH
jgi:hypothetical protein